MLLFSVLFSVTFDVSTVNGGAIDGFLHPFLSVDHLLALLAVGFLCAQLIGRPALITLFTFALSLLAGAALGVVGVAVSVPAANYALLALVAALAFALMLAGRIPWQVGWLFAGAFGLLLGNAHASELQFSDTTYAFSYLLAFAIASIGLTWLGLALGYIGLRSRAGTAVLRLAGLSAALVGFIALGLGGAG